ncbi:MAG: hypothetical protein VCC99_04015 [Alphaproteobacteria bacterium]|jgi:hypothetical protein
MTARGLGVWLTAALVWIGPAHAEDTLAIVGATLIDGTGAPSLPDSVVVINGDRIAAVGTVDKRCRDTLYCSRKARLKLDEMGLKI